MKRYISLTILGIIGLILQSCGNQDSASKKSGVITSNAAERVYVAPGEHDEYYAFLSGEIGRASCRERC